jgi:hypothetical protein
MEQNSCQDYLVYMPVKTVIRYLLKRVISIHSQFPKKSNLT